jgi:uncharacterized RDD family membrane protein YckC
MSIKISGCGVDNEVDIGMLATPVQRLVARLIDGVVALFVLILGIFVVAVVAGHSFWAAAGLGAAALHPSTATASIVLGSLTNFGVSVYFLLLYKNGQTLGKKMMGIKIARYPDGGSASLLHIILLRMLLMLILELIPFIGWIFGIVNYCFIFRSDRRMLHDYLAGTVVIKA